MPSRRQFHALGLGLGLAAVAPAARPEPAQTAFAGRPLRIVVPFAPGGGPDVLVRALAPKLAEALGAGATVVVENVVGAGGIVAAQNVARARPDGHTLLLGASSHLVQKAMQPDVRFDAMRDFVHITLGSSSQSVLVVGADAPFSDLAGLLAAARAQPGRFNYASGGIGSAAHLCAEALALHAGIDVVHVPYKGSVDIVPSILAGTTQFAFPIASTAVPLVRAGRVKALAVSGAARLPSLPQVPTLADALQAPALVFEAWFGFWAPAGTPATVVDTLFRALKRAHRDADLRAQAEAAGSAVLTSESPQEFTRFMTAETGKFERLVASARLRGDR